MGCELFKEQKKIDTKLGDFSCQNIPKKKSTYLKEKENDFSKSFIMSTLLFTNKHKEILYKNKMVIYV